MFNSLDLCKIKRTNNTFAVYTYCQIKLTVLYLDKISVSYPVSENLEIFSVHKGRLIAHAKGVGFSSISAPGYPSTSDTVS